MFRTTAIQVSIDNNFESGVHFHATGTGKSLIALQLLLEFNNGFAEFGKKNADEYLGECASYNNGCFIL